MSHDISLHNVVKSNSLVTASYTLSIMEKRLLLAVLAKYDQTQDLPMVCELYAAEFKDLFKDVKLDYYKELKQAIKKFFERDIQYYNENMSVGIKLRWVQAIHYDNNQSKVVLKWANDIMPHISNLKSRFTQYKVKEIIQLKRPVSMRIFEIIQMNRELNEITFPVSVFRDMLLLGEKYKKHYELKRFVVEPALTEIKETLDIDITLEEIKEGRTIQYLKFSWNTTDKPIDQAHVKSYCNNIIYFQQGEFDFTQPQPEDILLLDDIDNDVLTLE